MLHGRALRLKPHVTDRGESQAVDIMPHVLDVQL